MTMRSRSELKQKYREAGTPMGIFAVRNTRNGKVLIGGTMNLPGALNRAGFSLRLGGHSNRELQRDWNEMGPDAFTFEVLDELERGNPDPSHDYRDDLAALEALWLEQLRPYGDAGYHRPPAE